MVNGEKANVMVTAYITEAERARLVSAAAADDRKVSAFVRVAIREKIEREAKA